MRTHVFATFLATDRMICLERRAIAGLTKLAFVEAAPSTLSPEPKGPPSPACALLCLETVAGCGLVPDTRRHTVFVDVSALPAVSGYAEANIVGHFTGTDLPGAAAAETGRRWT